MGLRCKLLGSGCVIALSSIAVSPAEAQTAPSQPAPSQATPSQVAPTETTASDATTAPAANSGQLEEIIVTAQRVGQNLQRVPIAVSTISGADAVKLGVTDPQVLAQAVPGLSYPRIAGGGIPYIRGVGTPSSTIGNEPSIATFIDDVYVTNGAAAFSEFNNVEQIEVLKGPQGTLFGRNATGGVIHVHTRNPTQTPTMDVAGTVANYQTYDGQLYASTGITDNLAVNIAAYGRDQRNGWGRNVVTGDDAFKVREFGVRMKALFEPDTGTSVLISGDIEKHHGEEGLAGRVLSGYFSRNAYNPDAAGAGFYDTTGNLNNRASNGYRSISAKVKHDFGVATLVSITALSRITSVFNFDVDTSPTPFFNGSLNEAGKTFTQELQLVSPTGAPIQWLIGAFYLNDKATYKTVFTGQAFGAAGQATFDNKQDTDSYSGFAQATAEIMPNTNLTLGLRYTSDRRVYNANTTFGPTPFGPINDRRTFENLSGRAALDHKITDNVMAYIAYNRGFKSGIFNLGGQALASTTPPPPAEPEELNAYSLGFKSEWFEKRLRLNVEAFYYDYKNIQVATQVVTSQIITNAGAAHIKGVDLDLVALPVPRLTIRASASIEDGKYTKFPNGPENLPLAPNPPVAIPQGCFIGSGGTRAPGTPYPTGTAPLVQIACDLSGNDTTFTPRLSSNLSLSYRIDAPLPIDLALSWAHKSSYFFETDNNVGVRQPTTDLFNASLQISSSDNNYSIRFWGNNISNKKYYIYMTQSATSGIKYSPAPPRTFGATISAHF